MSFNFQWPTFSRQFHADAAKMLDAAMNRGPKPKVIADDIKVEEINMGTVPPELEILEIGELSSERLRGIFRLTYAGDAHLLLSTKVQANPLTRPEPAAGASSPFEDVSSAFPSSSTSRGILFAARPLVVPMQLRLSSVRLKAIIVLVVSKQKGITLVFKNDPLESVDVNSTFDSVAVIQKYLQQEIEGQLREMFREDLPGIIHRLSQTWLSGRNRKQASGPNAHSPPSLVKSPASLKSELADAPSPFNARQARSSPSLPILPKGKSPARRKKSNADKSSAATPSSSPPLAQRASTNSTPRAMSSARMERNTTAQPASSLRPSPSTSPTKKHSSTFDTSYSTLRSPDGLSDDADTYDPTYGLRPNDVRIPANGTNFQGLARLAGRENRGFGDLSALSSSAKSEEAQVGPIRSVQGQEYTKDALPKQNERGAAVGSSDEGLTDMEDPIVHEEALVDQEDSDDVPDFPEGMGSGVDGDDDEDEDDEDIDDEAPSDEDFGELDSNNDGNAAVRDRYDYPFGQNRPPLDHGSTRLDRSTSIPSGLSSNRLPSSSRLSAGRRSRTTSASASTVLPPEVQVEYETIPAVGGGMATRPRVYHIASRIQAPDIEEEDDLAHEAHHAAASSIAASSTARGPASSRTTMTARPRQMLDEFDAVDENEAADYVVHDLSPYAEDEMPGSGTDDSPSAAGHESLATLDPIEMDPTSSAYRTQVYRQQYGRMYRPGYGRQSSISSTDLSSKTSSSRQASQSADRPLPGSRASTAPTSTHPSTYTTRTSSNDSPLKHQQLQIPITRGEGNMPMHARRDTRPVVARSPPRAHGHGTQSQIPASGSGHNMTIDASHHFMDLVNSNHTLSPFTRTLDTKGYAVRSHPVTPSSASASASASASVASGNTGARHGRAAHSTTGGISASQMHARLNRLAIDQKTSSNGGGSDANHGIDSGGSAHGGSSRPSTGGRRRTFKLGTSSSSTSTGLHTPSSVPGTPVGEVRSGSASRTSGVQRWRPAMSGRAHSIASTEQEQGSSIDDSGMMISSDVSRTPMRAGRRPSYDHRHRYNSADSAMNDSEFSAVQRMGSIRE